MNQSIETKYFTSFALFEPLWPRLTSLGPTIAPLNAHELSKIITIPPFAFIEQSQSSNFINGYEAHIYVHHEIPTRTNNWHDFFNALVWERFIHTKSAINHLHFHLQQRRYPHKQRLPEENMLTLFDENGAIIIAQDESIVTLIREHRWHELFWQRRADLHRQLKVVVFGHGMYEKSLQPYIGLTAKCLLFVAKDSSLNSIDKLVADFLLKSELNPSLLAPLPILGLPGWWEANNSEDFYFNRDYFRPKIAQKTQCN